MKRIEKYCDICGAKERDYGFRTDHRIRHFSVRTFGFHWEKVDVCDECYKEMVNLVREKRELRKKENEHDGE